MNVLRPSDIDLFTIQKTNFFEHILTISNIFCLFFQFQEAEKKRYRAEQHRFEMKHQRQLEEARATSAAAIKVGIFSQFLIFLNFEKKSFFI